MKDEVVQVESVCDENYDELICSLLYPLSCPVITPYKDKILTNNSICLII